MTIKLYWLLVADHRAYKHTNSTKYVNDTSVQSTIKNCGCGRPRSISPQIREAISRIAFVCILRYAQIALNTHRVLKSMRRRCVRSFQCWSKRNTFQHTTVSRCSERMSQAHLIIARLTSSGMHVECTHNGTPLTYEQSDCCLFMRPQFYT